MKNRTPIVCDRCRAEGIAGLGAFSAMKPLLDFKPVPRRARHDGWTPKRQRAFIAALAETGSVSQAAAAVNMSSEGAYYLRRQPGSDEFGAAWDSALDFGADIVDGKALERSIQGVPVPIFHGGRQVGERRVFNERLTMFLLQHRKPAKYGHAKNGDLSADERQRAESIREEALARGDEWLEKIIALYQGRVTLERRCRLRGDVVGADFYLRQLTHMEVLIELGGGGKFLLWWANGGNGSRDCQQNGGEEIATTELTRRLDTIRRECWEKASEPDRPPIDPRPVMPCGAMAGGPDIVERERAMQDARARAAAAQIMWEEAVRDQAAARAGAQD